MRERLALLFAGLSLHSVSGQTFVGHNRSQVDDAVEWPAPPEFSDNCRATFDCEIACDVRLLDVAFNGYFPDADDLDSICTPGCFKSLSSFREEQRRACINSTWTDGGHLWPATRNVDTMLWTYNYTCRKDATSAEYCAPAFDAWANGDDSVSDCSDCVLGTYQLQLSNDLGWDDDLADTFSSITSSCQATGYPLTSLPPNRITATRTATHASISTTHSAEPKVSCTTKYTVKDGDDCHSISLSEKVSTIGLLWLNGLQSGCTNFPGPSTELCMPDQCDVYTVKSGDSCYGIAEAHDWKFNIGQLKRWNKNIDKHCRNLASMIGSQICVTHPGHKRDSPNVTITQSHAPIPTTAANGTYSPCADYYEAQADDTPASVIKTLNLQPVIFFYLNPTLSKDLHACLTAGASYCVRATDSLATWRENGPFGECGGLPPKPMSCYDAHPTLLPPYRPGETLPLLHTHNLTTTSAEWPLNDNVTATMSGFQSPTSTHTSVAAQPTYHSMGNETSNPVGENNTSTEHTYHLTSGSEKTVILSVLLVSTTALLVVLSSAGLV